MGPELMGLWLVGMLARVLPSPRFRGFEFVGLWDRGHIASGPVACWNPWLKARGPVRP